MTCVPKSYAQASGEVKVTASFLNNFAGDNVRRLAKSFGVAGDHYGQMSVGHRWPYGPVALVTPFNFPLEIPVLQLMGALYMGNKPVLKPSEQVSVSRYAHWCWKTFDEGQLGILTACTGHFVAFSTDCHGTVHSTLD